MGEESSSFTMSSTVPFDRTVDQAIVSIKKGAYLLKCGRRGKPKLCPFRLSQDEKNLTWYSGQQEKHLRLSSVTKIVQGQGNVKPQKLHQSGKECDSFSLIYANGERSLHLICKDRAQATSWFVGLKAIISRSQHQKPFSSLRSCKGIQSCVSSPAGILRRKKNLGLLEDAAEFAKVHSVCASPALSLSERCFSDGLSYTCESFYSSESLPSDVQRATDNSVPSSPFIDPNILSKSGSTYVNTEYQNDLSYKYLVPDTSPHVANSSILKDVMIWGGGIVGIAGSGDDQLVEQQGAHVLLPKLLESTTMLDVEHIALGDKHAALVTIQGEVLSWGEGKGGRLGLKIDMDISSPKILDSLGGVHVKDVACGEYHMCALTNSGEVYAWGNDGCVADQFGEGRFKTRWIPRKLSGPLDGIIISHVTCGEWHTAIVSSCGRLFTYGDGTFGALGHGNSLSISQPKEVESLKGLWVRSVACGSWHTAAVVEVMVDRFRYNTGKLFTWGDGEKGVLGHADNGRKLLPTCVSPLLDCDFVQVSCGRMLTVALTNMGKVFTMGSSVHGQLGNPRAKDKSVTIVEGLLKQEFVKEISSGSYHVAVLTSSRSVYTWGKGANGQLGLGDTEDRYSPSFVVALRDWQVERIACGPSNTAAICLHKPISISDQSACSGCKLPFGFTRKKHNCYNCGLLFCHPCSGKKITNAALAPNKNKAFRVCDQCFNKQLSCTPSVLASKSKNYNSQKLLKNQNKLTDLTEDRGETEATQGPLLLSLGQSCYKRSMPGGKRDGKNRQESKHNLGKNSSVFGGVAKWGQVSCPSLFENCTEISASSFRNKLGSLSSVNLEATVSNNSFGEKDTAKSDNALIEEVKRLRAEARILEEKCEIGKQELQECHKKIDETWLLAKEEAAKSKAAKEVIKALVLRLFQLQTVSDKTVAAQEGKLGIQECLSNLTPIRTDVNSPKDGNVDSLLNSPIVFSDSLKSKLAKSSILKSDRSKEDSQLTKAESHEDSSEGLKVEQVEQYEPGVYITLTSLPCGQKGLKRVRFSRKQFSEKEAERWWEKNQALVYQKYRIEGYIKTSQNWEKG